MLSQGRLVITGAAASTGKHRRGAEKKPPPAKKAKHVASASAAPPHAAPPSSAADDGDLASNLCAAEAAVLAGFDLQDLLGEKDDEGEGDEAGEDDAYMKLLKDGMENSYGLRGALGQKFARSLSGGKSPEYKGTPDEKRKFRQEWAAIEFDRLDRQRKKSKTYKSIDSLGGFYTPFRVIVQKEGDDDDALIAAKHYIQECLRRKGKWIKWNGFTKRVEYLYVQTGKREEFEHAISLQETQSTSGGRANAPGTSAPGSSNDPAPGGGTPLPGGGTPLPGGGTPLPGGGQPRPGGGRPQPGGAGGAGAPAPRPDPEEGKKTPKAKTPLDEAFKQAWAAKKRYEEAVAKGNAIYDCIRNEEAWQWANNEAMLCKFLAARTGLLERRSSFAREVLASDGKQLRARWTDRAVLQSELTKFVQEVDGQIKEVMSEIGCLRAMHEARLKVQT